MYKVHLPIMPVRASCRQYIERLRVAFICIVVGQGNPTEDQNNLSKTRLLRVSDEIIQVRRWDFTTIHHDGYFFSPTLQLLRFYMNSVSSAYFF